MRNWLYGLVMLWMGVIIPLVALAITAQVPMPTMGDRAVYTYDDNYVCVISENVVAGSAVTVHSGPSLCKNDGFVAAETTVRFGQQGVSATFRHGEFAGTMIEDVAAGLRSGAIKADQLPIQTITRDGVSYTVNNRSLMALRQAGLEPTVITDVTGNAVLERELTKRLSEMGGQVAPDFVPVVRGAR